MSRHRRRGICVYCGRHRKLTSDHVPPRNLFPAPRPTNLITVPACTDCNTSAKLDDEYFRLMVSMREDVHGEADVQAVLPAVLRSLQNPAAIGFRAGFLRSLCDVNVVTPAGLYTGIRPGYNVNLARMDRVAARIVRGLFYHETGLRLPDGYDAAAYSSDGIRPELHAGLRTVFEPLVNTIPKSIGRVFSYWCGFKEDPNASAWVLLFYRRVLFICMTAPKECSSGQIDLSGAPT